MSSLPDIKRLTNDAQDTFPYSSMRWLGAIQISTGVLVFIMGVVDLILTKTSHDRDIEKYGSEYETVVTMTVVATPLWCGLWYSITGGLGACLATEMTSTLFYGRVTFIILNVLCCAVFGPACAVINGYLSYTRHNLDKSDIQWLFSLIVCFLAIIEVIMATVSAFFTCCCYTLRPTQVQVFVNSRKMSRSASNYVTGSTVSGIRTRSSTTNLNNFSSIGNNNNNNSGRVTATTDKSRISNVSISHKLRDTMEVRRNSDIHNPQRIVSSPVKNVPKHLFCVQPVTTDTYEYPSSKQSVSDINESHFISKWTPLFDVNKCPTPPTPVKTRVEANKWPGQPENEVQATIKYGNEYHSPGSAKKSIEDFKQDYLLPVSVNKSIEGFKQDHPTPVSVKKSIGGFNQDLSLPVSVNKSVEGFNQDLSPPGSAKKSVEGFKQNRSPRCSTQTPVEDAREYNLTPQSNQTPIREFTNAHTEKLNLQTKDKSNISRESSSYMALKKWALPR